MKKICVVTGTRAEFGLLLPLLRRLSTDSAFELQIVAGGMHLRYEFGFTVSEIEKAGFSISKKVDFLLDSDTKSGLVKSTGLGMILFSEAFGDLQPDLVVVLGDRFEIFAASFAAMAMCIPIAHIHGGESTFGLIDESIRHSVSKMSQLHFVSTEQYRQRLIRMGEDPRSVFNCGALGLDGLDEEQFLDINQLEQELGFQFSQRAILVTFHPVSLESVERSLDVLQSLLAALDSFPEINCIFTAPNAEAGGRQSISAIKNYVASHPGSIFVHSLGRTRYLSCLRLVEGVVGNSSSGIIEVPHFKIGTVNIGDRQAGRVRAASVVDCGVSTTEIAGAINTILQPDFKASLKGLVNPYDSGGASERILAILKGSIEQIDLKKRFYDGE
ncbi:UDP-N-acetylglucosamine 2-epimerase [Litoricolaceae bacterium]|nr:UDP-N-acetylglucosamine 2-epimerase [Litorivicinaceae bacterium]